MRWARCLLATALTGSDGKPTRVLGVYPQGTQPVYRVTFSDGSSVEAGAEHLWAIERNVGTTSGGRIMRRVREVLTTEQLRRPPLRSEQG